MCVGYDVVLCASCDFMSLLGKHNINITYRDPSSYTQLTHNRHSLLFARNRTIYSVDIVRARTPYGQVLYRCIRGGGKSTPSHPHLN